MKLNKLNNKQLEILEDLSGEDAADWRKNDSAIEIDGTDSVKSRRQLALISKQLSYADLAISPTVFVALSFVLGLIVAVGVSRFLSPKLALVYFLVGSSIPWLYVERRIKERANRFTEDYSTMLMAAASSIKVGLTPYHALERSVNLLPKESLVKTEIYTLLNKLKRGDSRDAAIDEFAATIRQPDVELFRSAFKLVLENGGRFAPTLTRLASVSYGRMSLIRSALVSTANMRMTANCLLIAAPVMLAMMSVKTPNYWQTLFNNPQANIFASIGVLMILGSYAVLRHFSNFKP
jgi:Flp pilus assembly protein TadB